MSFAASTATFHLSEELITPIEKLFLFACAHRVGDTGECWPSIQRLCSDMGGCDPKTVTKIRKSLIAKGLLAYTGTFEGRSSQIPVMKLMYLDSTVSESLTPPKSGTSTKITPPKKGGSTPPKSGGGDPPQKWCTEYKRENIKEEYKKPSIVSQKKSLSISFEEASKNNNHGITEEWFNEWKAARKKPITQRVWNKTNGVMDELCIKGITGKESFEIMLDKQWEGMEVRYYEGEIAYKKNGCKSKPTGKGDALSSFLYNNSTEGNTYDQHGNSIDPFRRPRTN